MDDEQRKARKQPQLTDEERRARKQPQPDTPTVEQPREHDQPQRTVRRARPKQGRWWER
jgi:hypothetical protein